MGGRARHRRNATASPPRPRRCPRHAASRRVRPRPDRRWPTRCRCRRGQDVGDGALAGRGRPHVSDVDQRGRDDAGEAGSGHDAGDTQQQQVRRDDRAGAGHRRADQGDPHDAHPADPVGHEAPHRLHEAVGEEVPAGHRGDGGERGLQLQPDRHEQRGDREPVDIAGERRGLQQQQAPALPATMPLPPTSTCRHRPTLERHPPGAQAWPCAHEPTGGPPDQPAWTDGPSIRGSPTRWRSGSAAPVAPGSRSGGAVSRNRTALDRRCWRAR